MPPAVDVQARPLAEPQPPRKRRRSREPDWNAFYKNGLPKEVIVIDDTPEPERPSGPTGSSQTLVGSGSAQQTAPNSAPGSSAKKRKRDDEPTPYDPVRHSAAVGSHTPSKSTAASDRTNSAIHTTAATSLGSLSSNGQYEYETQAAQKRKRTTRQQIANEARRREAAIVSDALAHYRPPPYPPKKERDVHIKVIQDVSNSLFPPFFFFLEQVTRSLTLHLHSLRTARTSVSTMSTVTTSSSRITTSQIDVSTHSTVQETRN
jgi:dual-specificity kinase